MKKRIIKKIIETLIVSFAALVMTFSSLMYGAITKTTICDSMALAFDRYLRKTNQTYVAAQFKSDDPRDPIRRSEFADVSIYQNLWQLKNGPDNSLIRVMTPAFLEKENSLVYPLTLYPEFNATDDSNEIKPVVYSGYDQDFKGDYLDIKIKQFDGCDLQVNWSDFYSGGKLENYKTDTHSIMVSETVARNIFSARYDVNKDDIKDEELSVLLGTTIRCKMIKETGTLEAPEREKNKPTERQDSTIIESDYYSEEACRVKKIIGILDNKSAEKYFPLIGNDFVFVVPTNYVSYDYFHPIVYGMFKNNLVGNKTSLKYFMAFSDFAEDNQDYHLNFCDIENNELKTEGYLQKNYNSCLKFYSKNNFVLTTIFLLLSLASFGILTCLLLFFFLKSKNIYRTNKIRNLFIILGLFLFFAFMFSLIKGFTVFNFIIPTLTVSGFVLLFSLQLFLSFLLLILGKKVNFPRKLNQLNNAENNDEIIHTRRTVSFKAFLNNVVIGIVLSISSYLLVNVALLQSGINSIGIPFVSAFIGGLIAMNLNNNRIVIKHKLDRKMILSHIYLSAAMILGMAFGIGLCIILQKFNLIWIEGINMSIKPILISFALGVLVNIVSFWCILLWRRVRYNFIVDSAINSKESLTNYESIDI